MAYQHILVSTECGTATVTLNRPDKRNALSLPLMRELTEALQDVGRSTARGVILAANGT
ncbi:MAG: enoyl-CoA hydratase, partial [Betaproteobacteria bacterium]|nr:enoyl-CoA hydratase [Betaproteobacteria bacterium]